jgi:voltage-gated potassium channel
MNKAKRKVYAIVETVSFEDLTKQRYDFYDVFMVILILLNVLSVILETVESLYARYPHLFKDFEIFSVLVFTLDYVLRLWSCTEIERYRAPIWGRVKFAFSFLALVDLFSFLPFYLPMVIPFDLRFLRAFRLFRFIRILKIGRYSEAARLFGRVLTKKKAELLTAIFAIFILLVISSSLLYFVEHEAQPDKFKNIPEAMWWGVVTLTTVGYGDIYPITGLGKLFGSIMSLMGIGLFALPAGILSAGFVEEIKTKKESTRKCPYCGGPLD